MILQDELQDLLPCIPVWHWDLKLRTKPAHLHPVTVQPLVYRPYSTGTVINTTSDISQD